MANVQGNLNIPVDGTGGYLRYTGSDTLKVGYIVANPAPGDVGNDAEKAQAHATKPSGSDELRFAGVVDRKQTGSGRVLVRRNGLAYVYVKDTSVVSGDFLVPDDSDQYQATKAASDDESFMMAVEDSGDSAGLVLCRISQFPTLVV